MGDKFLHFLLKDCNITFKSGAGLLEPWKRFVGGRVGVQILSEMLVFFNPRPSLVSEWERVVRQLVGTLDLEIMWNCLIG